jgi:hypothetical protein
MRDDIELTGTERGPVARSVVTSTIGFMSEVFAALPGFASDKARRNAWEALCAHRARRTEWEDADRWMPAASKPKRPRRTA